MIRRLELIWMLADDCVYKITCIKRSTACIKYFFINTVRQGMRVDPVVMVVDSKEVFDLMEPILADFLQASKVVHCVSHQQAMDYVDSDQRADFIFADWQLTGHEFVLAVRNDLENHNTPLIIMSEDVRIKGIVLDEIENRSSFFLSKPFLGKGLKNKISEVVEQVERRRETRLRPQKAYQVKVNFSGEGLFSFALVDISIFGALFRVPLEQVRQLSIYLQAQVDFQIEGFDVDISAELCRIGYDKPIPQNRDTVLIMMKFVEKDRARIKLLQQMLDELNAS